MIGLRRAVSKMGISQKVKKTIFWCKEAPRNILSAFLPSAYVLLYHRVADVTDDPHLLAVRKKHFEDHIRYLTEKGHVISLNQLVQDIKNHSVRDKSVVVTFDDGYADNFYNAYPILKKYNAPFTVFVSALPMLNQETFPWDAGTDDASRGRPMTKDELLQLAQDPLVSIESHTLSHPRLIQLADDEQFKELSESRRLISTILQKDILGLSYPFGSPWDFDRRTVAQAKKTGYTFACANYPGHVTQAVDLYRIPRYLVRDWPIEIAIEKWRGLL
ncbi:polysaccharide deacetylase family protein [Patescibacteria group bacterium]|nr:polysaccharide deacetylase family protein [Patescibacteria group bacterium]